MSEDRSQSARQKRVRRLKRIIIGTLFVLILVPIVCCIFLFYRVGQLEERVDVLAGKLAGIQLKQSLWYQRDGFLTESSVKRTQPEPDASPEGEAGKDAARKVYLTFDDGPSIYTDEILDILKEYDVKATFFVVGKEDKASQMAIQRIVSEGHTLGMHSYSHKYAELYATRESFQEDFEKQRTYLEGLTGVKMQFYRFPGGSSNTVSKTDMTVLAQYLEEQSVTFYDWNISSGDGGRAVLDVDTLVRNSTQDLARWNTDVILLHDSAEKPTTVEALPAIIEAVRAMEDTELLPITEATEPVQHIHIEDNNGGNK